LSMQVASVLSITTATLPQAYVSDPYSATFIASGGVPPYSWSAAAGAGQTGLPAGMTFSTSGVLAGTVSTSTCSQPSCVYSFTVSVTDSTGTLVKMVVKLPPTK
jgi:hypothetical protein